MNNPANVPTLRFLRDAGLGPGMRVLDIGCGSGLLTREIAGLIGKDGHVTGIDRDDSALAQAGDQPKMAGSGAISYEAADLSGALPDWAPFDAIVGRRVLMYLPDASTTIERLITVLKPGGMVLFQEHGATGMPFATQPVPQHKQAHDWIWRTIAAEQGSITMGLDLPKLFQRAGLRIDHYRAEAVMLGSAPDQGVEDIARYMVDRVIDAGVADRETIQPDSLPDRLAEERRLASPILWDMAYLIGGQQQA